MSKTNEQLLQEVMENTTAVLQKEKITLPAERAAVIIPTIVNTFLEQAIIATKNEASGTSDGKATLEVSPLLDINVSNRESNDGEKDGNRIVTYTAGPQARLIGKSDGDTEPDED